MARTSTYLNFDRKTEEAFNFYKSVFGGEFMGEISRMSEVPPQEGVPPLPEADKNLIMHIGLPIYAGHMLYGTDTPEFMRSKLVVGTNVTISLETDTREETDKLFAALSAGGQVTMPLQMMFWGDYYGMCTDKFGVQWMFNCASKK